MTIRLAGVAGMVASGWTSLSQTAVQKVMAGDTKVTVLSSYAGSQPLSKPLRTLVYRFNVPTDVITLDHSVAATTRSHGPIARMKGDAGRNDSPDAVATHVQAAFSDTLVKELNKTLIPASPSDIIGMANLPVKTLIVRGDFTNVNLGNQTKRMMVGFGRGASDVKAHTIVSLITESGSVLLAEFDLKSESGKKPGAAATMGVGSAAGSVATNAAMDGRSTVEADASRMAKTLAKQIERIMATQHWIAPISE